MTALAKRNTVRIDTQKNRLYCKCVGNVGKEDIDSYFTEIRFAVADLKPDFSLILDLTEVSYGHISAVSTLTKIMQYLIAHGVNHVVRVVDDRQLINLQFQNFAVSRQGYEATHVNSLAEADAFLDNNSKRAHIRIKLRNKAVAYSLPNEKASGQLLDISLGGCAITTARPLPEAGESIRVRFSLQGKKNEEIWFELDGRIVRHIDGGFTVTFEPLPSADRQKLRECMAKETAIATN